MSYHSGSECNTDDEVREAFFEDAQDEVFRDYTENTHITMTWHESNGVHTYTVRKEQDLLEDGEVMDIVYGPWMEFTDIDAAIEFYLSDLPVLL